MQWSTKLRKKIWSWSPKKTVGYCQIVYSTSKLRSSFLLLRKNNPDKFLTYTVIASIWAWSDFDEEIPWPRKSEMNPPKLISPSFVFRHWPDLAVDVVFTFENAQEGFLLVHEILSDLLWTARSNMKRAIDALLSCQTQSEHRSCSRHQSNQFHPTELWVFGTTSRNCFPPS